MRLTKIASLFIAAMGLIWTAAATFAQEVNQQLEILGRPVDGAMGFQPAATDLAQRVHDFDHMILLIITAISIFVTLLLVWVAVRYNRRANPTPATFTHNSPLEVTWTIVPIVILVFIGAFSLPVLFEQEEIPTADITVKVTGYQWYWGYEYVDENVAFDSYMIGAGQGNINPEIIEELEAAGYSEQDFHLATDNALVIPVGKTIVVQLTGADVIHAWMVPAFGVQLSAVPGRLAELWFRPEREGIYFGQCTSLCGMNHAYMPITVKVVSQETYDAWLAEAKVQNAAS
jgi:cytochrome c oxidase subunit 2